MAVILINRGTRGAVDIDLPGTGREREMAVRRAKKSDQGVGREVVTQLVKINVPRSITLRPGERSRPLPDSVVNDPVIGSRIRSGVLAAQPVPDRPARKPKPTAEPAKPEAKPEAEAKPATDDTGTSGRKGRGK